MQKNSRYHQGQALKNDQFCSSCLKSEDNITRFHQTIHVLLMKYNNNTMNERNESTNELM